MERVKEGKLLSFYGELCCYGPSYGKVALFSIELNQARRFRISRVCVCVSVCACFGLVTVMAFPIISLSLSHRRR